MVYVGDTSFTNRIRNGLLNMLAVTSKKALTVDGAFIFAI
jgi:hypothetical protein